MSRIGILSLSEDLYPVLLFFLGYEDYWYFITVAKHHFAAIKRKTSYFALNSIYSLRFLTNEDHFQERIYSLVENPSRQIELDVEPERLMNPLLADLRMHSIFSYPRHVTIPLENIPLFSNIKELSLLGFEEVKNISNVSHLDGFMISEARSLVDITPLRDVPTVSLCNCELLSDFSILGKQKKLEISFCPKLQDVKNFSNIHTLTLSNCPLSSDLSPLKNVPILSIGHCPLISDLSPLLGSHEKLTISFCGRELKGYHILSNVPKVSLAGCDIKDVSVLKDAKSVSLEYCNDLVDITALANVNEIELNFCEKIIDLSVIAVIVIAGDLKPSRIRKYKNRIELNLIEFQLSHIQYLPTNVSHLEIELHPDVKYFSSDALRYFQNLQWLRIEAQHDFSTEGLADIPHIELSCYCLKDISGLGRNREVHLKSCFKIRDVSSLKDVPIIVIISCPNIVNLSSLAKVPRFRLQNVTS